MFQVWQEYCIDMMSWIGHIETSQTSSSVFCLFDMDYLKNNKNITKEKLIEYAKSGLKKREKKEETYLEDL